jgi:catechol 2,3-dioxygenase-like lactoylglutathione lyase family enzyme
MSDRPYSRDSLLAAIDHVQLAMPAGGEEAARSFFGSLLGLVEVPKPAALRSRGGCWFEGRVRIHLGVDRSFVPAAKAHPAFLLDDLHGLRSRLEEAGYTTQGDESWTGVERFYVGDPFGNRLEFLRRPSDEHESGTAGRV